MADIALTQGWTITQTARLPLWLRRLIHRVRIERRRARRARYRAVSGRAPRRYDWVAELARATGGRF